VQAQSLWFGIEVRKLTTGGGEDILRYYAARDGNRKSAGRLIKVRKGKTAVVEE
jgi:hypothetical protein